LAIGASFLLSVVQTSNSPTTAYFSPFTRAWELALGALIAISTPVLLRMPRRLAPAITWVGMGAVIVAAVTFTTATAYPGWRVAVPVVGSALIIAGGTPVPRFGAEWLLRTAPFRHLGKLSFSLYLWHWPILILAAEADGMTTVPLAQAIGWLALAYVAALATYHLVEDPIRHYRRIIRNRWASVGLGIVLTGATLCTLIVLFQVHGGNREVSAGPVAAGGASPQQVQRLVASSVHVQAVPRDLTPAIWGGPSAPGCFLSAAETTAPACVFGDTHGDRTMIVYGDSHAAMWFQTLDDIATGAGWRLMILSKGSCPAELLPFVNPPGVGPSGGEFRACAQWHAYAVRRINQVKPNLVVVTQEAGVGPHDSGTRAEWQTGLSKLFAAIHVRAARLVVLGNIPLSPKNGTACVEEHPTNLPICAGHIPDFYSPWRAAEQRAAAVAHAQYIDTLPWFCSQGICPAVIGHYSVYFDRYHVTAPYARYLETVLGDALHLQPTTELLVPSPNAVLTGSRIPLAAEVSDNASVRSLQFVLTGHDHRTVVIAKGTRTVIGYLATWNSLRAPNGRYSMQSRVTNAAGDVEYSPKVPVRVRNLRGAPPPGRLPTAQSGLNAVKLGGENPLALLSFQPGLEHDRTERQAFGT